VSLSIDQQIEAMSRLWPAFKLVRREGSAALWRGTVRPLLQTYRVSVFYRAPLMVERFSVRVVQPQVEILAPALRPRRGDAEGMLPHVYYGPDGGGELRGYPTEAKVPPQARDETVARRLWAVSEDLTGVSFG